MNDIREILTKAVIGRGQRGFEIDVKLPQTPTIPDRTLGAFITNHMMMVKQAGNLIEISGTFDIHVWYSTNGDTETNIAKSTVDYGNFVELRDTLRPHLLSTDEIICEEIVAPYATDVRIEDGIIATDTKFEIGVEVIGETKMRVAILGPVIEKSPFVHKPDPTPIFPIEFDDITDMDDLSEIDLAINDDFLDATIENFN